MLDPLALVSRLVARLPHATLTFSLGAATSLFAQTQFDHLQKDHLPQVRGSVREFLWFDADGDGDLDAQLIGEAGALLLRNGPRDFAQSTLPTASIGSFRNRAAAMADFDGDGDLDIVIARDGTNRLYSNNGNGTFVDATATALPFSVAGSESVVAGDLDADGDVDILFGNVGAADAVLANDGTGRFAVRAAALPTNGGSNGLALFDADADGDLDLVRGGNAVGAELLHNNGAGVFGPATSLQANGATLAIVAGDIDNDGDLDLLLPKETGGCGLLRNLGNGAFADATILLPTGLPKPEKAVLFDLEGDRDLDVAFCTNNGTVLLRNDATGFVDVSSRLPAADGAALGIGSADADGDGDQDLFVSSGRLRLYVNERGGREFVDASGARIDYVQPCSRLCDIDNDGDLDLVTAPYSNPASGLLHVNDGKGLLRDETTQRWNPTGTQRTFYAFAVADVDRDGDQDIVLGQIGQDRLYLNDGRGNFADATATHLPVDADRTLSLALADLDNDGDLDITAANSLQPNRVWRNDGTGRFVASPTSLPAGDAFWSQGIAAADIDGDGDLDLIVADANTQTGSQARLYVNDGLGTFVNATAGRVPASNGFDGGIAIADIDHDGDIDFAALGALYVNDGTGTFADETLARLPGVFGLEPQFADFDNDGDLDLIGYQTLFLNDGTGHFVDASNRFAGSGFFGAVPRPYAIGDVDRDGDVDVIGSYDVFFNLHRHLSVPRLPSLGGSLQLDVTATPGYGTADTGAIVFVAARTLSRPLRLSSFGLLHLNPLTIVAADAVTIPASVGSVSRTWPIPNVSALVGFDLAAQALVLHAGAATSWKFTNVVTETVVR